MNDETPPSPNGMTIRRHASGETMSCPLNSSPLDDGGEYLNGAGIAMCLIIFAPMIGVVGLIYGSLFHPMLAKAAQIGLLMNLVIIGPTLWNWILRARISIDGDDMRVMHWPKFWSVMHFRGDEIEQVYCTEVKRVTGGYRSYSGSEGRRNPLYQYHTSRADFYYEVHVITTNNEVLTICTTVTLGQAKTIERRIEEAFGIPDKQVPGEFRPRKRRS